MFRAIWLASVALSSVLAAPAETNNGEGQIWAVLVAGSNEYGNYRHQADVCHAYQIFHRHGVPDSNIIVMMYDDIAQNLENPMKGTIINKPNGPDVYKNVPKDYKGEDVTPSNFVKVLTGDTSANGKILKSGPNDHVFVNFVDHGGPGLISFPNGLMYAHQLIKALKTMHKKKMYKKLAFYMEACESGSMFKNLLPNNINIFATTAANPDESSYACYWDYALNTFLGDEYSISWMEDIDSEEHQKNMTTETLLKQFQNVVKRVKASHPQMYGEKKYDKDHVTDYLGNSQKVTYNNDHLPQSSPPEPFKGSVSSRDVALEVLNRRIHKSRDNDEEQELRKKRDKLIKGRQEVDKLFRAILVHVTDLNIPNIEELEKSRPNLSMGMMPCYQNLVDNFSKNCVNINKNTYTMGHLYKLANLCIAQYPSDRVLEAYTLKCSDYHRALGGIN